MNRTLKIAAALALSTSSAIGGTAAAVENACEGEMRSASAKYEVPLGVLYAVGLTESGRKESLQPHAMNIEGTAYFATSVADGLRRFAEAKLAGARLIDIGCMQINEYFHGDRFPSVEAMFDPRANVDYGARFLKTLRAQEGSWTLAVARYHAGPNNNPAQKKYVCAVIVNMVATGFGSWTEAARDFCQ
jgi:soluble lytic murein transglycosylase-like protein